MSKNEPRRIQNQTDQLTNSIVQAGSIVDTIVENSLQDGMRADEVEFNKTCRLMFENEFVFGCESDDELD